MSDDRDDGWFELLMKITRSIYDIVPYNTIPFDQLDPQSKRLWIDAAEQIWDLCNHNE